MTKLILVVSALLLSGELAAQTFKCTNASGKITYSGKKCSDLGLKDAGEVKDQLNVTPAYRPSAQGGGSDSRPRPAPAARAPDPGPPAAVAEPAEPAAAERRCFTVQTAKGTATRCNDKPPND